MDTDHVHVLLTVIETGSLSAAANRLGYTPSGVSRIIAGLEKLTGFPLLIRGREGARATAECTAILPALRQLDYWAQVTGEKAKDIQGLETGTIRVGTVYEAFYGWLFGLVGEFAKKHPGIEVQITSGTSTEMCAAVDNRSCDFAITSRRSGNFDFIPLVRDRMMAILPKNHPLAHAPSFPLSRFPQENFIEVYRGKETDNSMIFHKYHIRPKAQISTTDRVAGYVMVQNGLGVALENDIMQDPYLEHVARVPVDPPQEIEIGITVPQREEISPAAQKFLDYALKNLSSITLPTGKRLF